MGKYKHKYEGPNGQVIANEWFRDQIPEVLRSTLLFCKGEGKDH